ncbi:MAG: family lipolytic protein [Flavisolibacter sp.]|nr:family lipolytic protein [Flavisolibacter sp.]
MKNRLTKVLLSFFILQSFIIHAQEGLPFWNEIQAFKKEDSLKQPAKNAILFTGSSSIRLWKDLQQVFPNHTIINRGFGGSSLTDMIRYADDIIFRYNAKQLVIYCGENDIASSDTVTGEMVNRRFQKLFSMIREQQPNVPVVFISIKPSPSRWHLRTKMVKANSLIKKFLATKKNTRFVDVWKPMLNKAGTPEEDLFVEDKLHMSAKGYAIWKQKTEPLLIN